MSLQRIPIIGFAPDLPSDTPGALLSCGGVAPTVRGLKPGWAAPTASRGGNGDLGTASITGVFAARVPAGTYTYYVGTTAKLWEMTAGGGTVTDRSGATYSSTDTTDGGWSFAQFGTKTLAVNKFNTLQVATTGSTAFADVSGAPKASIVVTVGGPTSPFAMVFNYNDGTDTPDGVFWSALADYTDWTPDVATQCGNIQIFEPSGPFTAAIKFRDGVLAWKENSMFLGTYVGTPDVWDWQRVASDVGCEGKGLVVSANDIVYFADQRGLWKYDGSYPQMISGPVQDYWARSVWIVSGATSPARNQLVWDAVAHCLHVKLAGGAQLTWNALTGMWVQGAIGGQMVVALRPSSGAATVLSQDSGTSHNFGTSIAEFGNTSPTVKIGYIGDPVRFTQITRVAPVWYADNTGTTAPGSATCVVTAWNSMPTDPVVSTTGCQKTSGTISLDSVGRYFDTTVAGNYLAITISNWNSNAEFHDIVIDTQPNGTA